MGEAVRLLGGADVSVAGLAWLERQAKVAEDLVAAGQAVERQPKLMSQLVASALVVDRLRRPRQIVVREGRWRLSL